MTPNASAAEMLSHLSYCTTDDIFKEGLHEYLDRTQLSLNEIGTGALPHLHVCALAGTVGDGGLT